MLLQASVSEAAKRSRSPGVVGDGVTEGVLVGVGVTVGVIEGVAVKLGVTVGVGEGLGHTDGPDTTSQLPPLLS